MDVGAEERHTDPGFLTFPTGWRVVPFTMLPEVADWGRIRLKEQFLKA